MGRGWGETQAWARRPQATPPARTPRRHGTRGEQTGENGSHFSLCLSSLFSLLSVLILFWRFFFFTLLGEHLSCD